MPKPRATASESYGGPAMGRCNAPATATEQPTKTKMNVPTNSATSGRTGAPPVLLLYSAISTPPPPGFPPGYLPLERPAETEQAALPSGPLRGDNKRAAPQRRDQVRRRPRHRGQKGVSTPVRPSIPTPA